MVVGVLVGLGCSGGSGDDEARERPSTTLAPVVTASGGGGELGVRPQHVGGDGFTVAEVSLDEPGFVAVFADGGGVPGELMGASDLLDAGTHEDVPVQLEVERSTRVFVVPFADTDGDGSLSWPEGDEPLGGETGATVVEVPIEP